VHANLQFAIGSFANVLGEGLGNLGDGVAIGVLGAHVPALGCLRGHARQTNEAGGQSGKCKT
jgi:hypothetical protein